MRLIRTIFSTLYIAFMVLLPWLHMPLHGQDAEEGLHAAHACGHHHHDDEQPVQKSDECGICELALVQAELPRVLLVPEALFVFSQVWNFTLCGSDASTPRSYEARAPPFKSV